jgi:hypothetical protein
MREFALVLLASGRIPLEEPPPKVGLLPRRWRKKYGPILFKTDMPSWRYTPIDDLETLEHPKSRLTIVIDNTHPKIVAVDVQFDGCIDSADR